jgi:hypothetical protein
MIIDTSVSPKLQANITNSEFLDAISGKPGNKQKKRTHNDLIELSDDDEKDAAGGEPRVNRPGELRTAGDP